MSIVKSASLKKSLCAAPDEGIARITPKRAGELLFDDILPLSNMQHKHDISCSVLAPQMTV